MLWHTCTRNQQIKNVAINNIIVKLNTPKCTSGGGGVVIDYMTIMHMMILTLIEHKSYTKQDDTID